MIRVTLTKDYFVDIDPLNYTLKKRYTGKTRSGEDRKGEKIIGYYGNLQQCVEKIIHESQIDSVDGQEMSIERYVRMIDNSNREILEELKDAFSVIENMLGGLEK